MTKIRFWYVYGGYIILFGIGFLAGYYFKSQFRDEYTRGFDDYQIEYQEQGLDVRKTGIELTSPK